jgi:hypothetical protein
LLVRAWILAGRQVRNVQAGLGERLRRRCDQSTHLGKPALHEPKMQ